jgi:hypothetical protein
VAPAGGVREVPWRVAVQTRVYKGIDSRCSKVVVVERPAQALEAVPRWALDLLNPLDEDRRGRLGTLPPEGGPVPSVTPLGPIRSR